MLSDNNPQWRRPVMIGAGVAAVVAVTAGLAYSCSADDTGRPASESATAGETFDLHTPPQQVTWSAYKGIALPVSAVSGPRGQDSGMPTGYAHTPQGAALDAIQTPVRISVADDATWAAAARVGLAPGAGRDAYSVNRVQVSITGEADPATRPRIRGYTISDYSPDAATVNVVTSYPDDSLASTRVSVIWRDDDWKVVLPDPADTARAATTTALTALPADLVALEAPR